MQPLQLQNTPGPGSQPTTIAQPGNPTAQPSIPTAAATQPIGTTTGVPVATEQPGGETSVPIASETVPVPVVTEPVAPTQPALPTLVITPPPQGSAAWAALRLEYVRFDSPRTYVAPASTLLWWYDPQTAQFVALGWIKGSIAAQGQFRVRGQWVEALEVPFQLPSSYGLTLDASVVERIRRAGYAGESIEAFIYLAPDLVLSQ